MADCFFGQPSYCWYGILLKGPHKVLFEFSYEKVPQGNLIYILIPKFFFSSVLLMRTTLSADSMEQLAVLL